MEPGIHTVAIANTDGLNVRQEPNTTSEIVTQVGQGEEMEYVETGSDGWVKISIDGEMLMYPKIMSQWKKAGYRHHHDRASLRTGGYPMSA